tara:strand:+ start:843 stop:1085 length:243 start_codon:yes stop_codon:yes gene_type:complete
VCKNPLKQYPDITGKNWDFGYVRTLDEFVEEVYELAFGDDAINRDYSMGEVLDRLRQYSDDALRWEEQEDLEYRIESDNL